ncbi:MAG: type I-E CRISPR-associated protein Cas7/Cse4/CasC, partial [Deltaproteobacteria bacterium]|nr:type I-E CRISPR-associated protein Cas7/Cse4/CasC [Deltaproteobacteria bacterium]
LARLIAEAVDGDDKTKERAERILDLCGFKAKLEKKEEDDDAVSERSKMLIYTTRQAIEEMAGFLKTAKQEPDADLAKKFAEIISTKVHVPDMALSGRMLEPAKPKKKKDGTKQIDVWKGYETTVEAALQVAHAISTHEARPEVDYYVAADDIPGDDAGAGYVDEAMFASACFYKFFSIDWRQLVKNLNGNEPLAAHTVGAFIRAAVCANPSGKQNSFAAHNPPDGLLVEFKKSPVSYANAFANPASRGSRDLVAQSIAQLAQYVRDIDAGFGAPDARYWFSPNRRFALEVNEDNASVAVPANNIGSLDQLIRDVVAQLGHDWDAVQQAVAVPRSE